MILTALASAAPAPAATPSAAPAAPAKQAPAAAPPAAKPGAKAAARPAPKPKPGEFDASAPATWKASAKLAKDSPLRAQLVKDLAGPVVHAGEAPLTAEEAQGVLDDPRAELVYGEKTVSIVAPSMIQRQRKDHLDLMAMFLKPERLAAGAKFARTHEALLAAQEKAHRVDRGVIVAILMWESKLGTITGDFVAFNAFVSQAFFIEEASAVALARKAEKGLIDEARQAERVKTIRARAYKNLLALLRQCKARGIDVFTMKGSWAGALGYPQFMPFSLRLAEDGDGDGKIDLFTFPDSIASIANYLDKAGYARSPERAVWDYNHEDAYVKGVLAFGKALNAQLDPKAAADAGLPLDASAPVPPEPVEARPPDAGPARDAG